MDTKSRLSAYRGVLHFFGSSRWNAGAGTGRQQVLQVGIQDPTSSSGKYTDGDSIKISSGNTSAPGNFNNYNYQITAKERSKVATINFFGEIKLIAEDVYKAIVKGESAITKYTPGGLAALAVLANGVEKALTDVASGAGNPASIVISLPTDISDFKALWPEAKSVLEAVGIKV